MCHSVSVKRLVLDSSVVISAFRSRRGASNRLLILAEQARIVPLATPALFLEYEDVLKRPEQRKASGLTLAEVDAAHRRLHPGRTQVRACAAATGRAVGKDRAMSKATYPLKLPASVKAAAARLAREDGVSLNQWIASAVAQKVGAIETAAAFFRRRAAGAKPGDLSAILARVPDRGPDPGDELPEGRQP